MQESRRTFTADDLTDAYWRGYTAAQIDRGQRRSVPRGWWLLSALILCILFWATLLLIVFR